MLKGIVTILAFCFILLLTSLIYFIKFEIPIFNSFLDRSNPNDVYSTTITHLQPPGMETSVIMDFSKCLIGKDSLAVAFGSQYFKFEGIKARNCIFYYGSSIENPNDYQNDGERYSVKCSVPASLGKKNFNVGNYGLILDEIKIYCSTNK